MSQAIQVIPVARMIRIAQMIPVKEILIIRVMSVVLLSTVREAFLFIREKSIRMRTRFFSFDFYFSLSNCLLWI